MNYAGFVVRENQTVLLWRLPCKEARIRYSRASSAKRCMQPSAKTVESHTKKLERVPAQNVAQGEEDNTIQNIYIPVRVMPKNKYV